MTGHLEHPISLASFVEWVEREQPETLDGIAVWKAVRPKPWVDRRGYGVEQRIQMKLGAVLYERTRDDFTWYRVDHGSTFDIEDAA